MNKEEKNIRNEKDIGTDDEGKNKDIKVEDN